MFRSTYANMATFHRSKHPVTISVTVFPKSDKFDKQSLVGPSRSSPVLASTTNYYICCRSEINISISPLKNVLSSGNDNSNQVLTMSGNLDQIMWQIMFKLGGFIQ